MIINPCFVFECDNPIPIGTQPLICYSGRQFFNSANALIKFLGDINWLASRYITRRPAGLVQYRLGSQLTFDMGTYQLTSNIQWGPRFLVAKAVRNGQALIPVDATTTNADDAFSGMIQRRLKWQDVDLSPFDAVMYNPYSQIWPDHLPNWRSKETVLGKYLDQVTAQQYLIRTLTPKRVK